MSSHQFRYKFVSGVGYGTTKLNAFDSALVSAGVGDYNIIKLSSILPPGAQEVDKIDLPAGSMLHMAYAENMVERSAIRENFDEVGIRLSYNFRFKAYAALCVAIPENNELAGIIMERTAQSYPENNEGYCAGSIYNQIKEAIKIRPNWAGVKYSEKFRWEWIREENIKNLLESDNIAACALAGIAIF